MADYDNAPMRLVYEHKTNGRKLVPNGLSIMDELDLTLVISESESFYHHQSTGSDTDIE